MFFLSLWLKSRPRDLVYRSQKFFASWHQFTWTNAYSIFLQPLHTYVDCPHLPLNLLMWSSLQLIPQTKFPRIANSCLRKTPNANHQPYLVDLHPPGNCWLISVKSYQAAPRLISCWLTALSKSILWFFLCRVFFLNPLKFEGMDHVLSEQVL
jgi:hypothetical protein